MASELRLPAVREQLVDSAGQVRRQPRENVLHVGMRIMPIELDRLNQAHDR